MTASPGPAMGSRPSVTVVGGGLAGITAALACADAGASVTLLESRPRLGGATWSFERDGRWYDNGQHVFLRCCTAYRGFLRRLGSEDGVHLQERLAIPVLAPGGKVGWIRRGPGPVPLHLAPTLGRYRHLGVADRLRLAPAARALGRLDLGDPALDEATFGQWLTERGQRPAAQAALWDLIVRPTVNLPASRASLAMAAKVFQTGLLADPSGADVGWARVPLSRLHGEAAGQALARAGVVVRLRAKVERLEPAPPAGPIVVVSGEPVRSDAVVLAVPHEAAAGLLPPASVARQNRLGELGSSPIVDVHLVYDRRVTDLPLAAGLHTPVQWLFDRTAAATGAPVARDVVSDPVVSGPVPSRPPAQTGSAGDEQVIAVSLSAATDWLGRRPEELIDVFSAALRALLPRARSARLVEAVVTRERAATFAAVPGTAALRPGPRTAVPGLVLAGAWTDTGWPATMEGAVRSGLAAARETLVALGQARSLPDLPIDPAAWPRRAHGRGGAPETIALENGRGTRARSVEPTPTPDTAQEVVA